MRYKAEMDEFLTHIMLNICASEELRILTNTISLLHSREENWNVKADKCSDFRSNLENKISNDTFRNSTFILDVKPPFSSPLFKLKYFVFSKFIKMLN